MKNKYKRYNVGYRVQDLNYEQKILTINSADKLMHDLTTMAIDGWFSGEYNLPDQRKVIESAKEYLEMRYPKVDENA